RSKRDWSSDVCSSDLADTDPLSFSPPSKLPRVLQVEVSTKVDGAFGWSAPAHLTVERRWRGDGLDARDVGGRWLQVPAAHDRGRGRRPRAIHAVDEVLRGGGNPTGPMARVRRRLTRQRAARGG